MSGARRAAMRRAAKPGALVQKCPGFIEADTPQMREWARSQADANLTPVAGTRVELEVLDVANGLAELRMDGYTDRQLVGLLLAALRRLDPRGAGRIVMATREPDVGAAGDSGLILPPGVTAPRSAP